MKTNLYVLLIGLLSLHNSVSGQTTATTSTLTLRRHVADIEFFSKKNIESGILFDLDDSTLTLAPIDRLKPRVKALVAQYGGRLPSKDTIRRVLPLRTYRYAQIRRLTLYRRGYAAKGLLLGAIAGALAGYVSGDESHGFISISAETKAVIFTIPSSLVGLFISEAMVKSVKAKKQAVAVDVPARFRKFTIVDQVKQATLYTP